MRVYTACDPVYMRQHLPALVVSCAVIGQDIIADIVDLKTESDKMFAYELMDTATLIARLSGHKNFSVELRSWIPPYPWTEGLDQLAPRVKYACARFLSLHQGVAGGVFSDTLVVDTDCLFMRKMDRPREDIGLFLRDPLPGTVGWEQEGTRVAAGLVYVSDSSTGRMFAENVRQAILDNADGGRTDWFLDQVSINEAYNHTQPIPSVKKFDQNDLDWDFRFTSVIWTGKGVRKHTDQRYLAMKQRFDHMILDNWL